MPKVPDRLYIEKQDRELYEELDKEEMLRSGRRVRRDQFLFALAFGFNNETARPISIKEGFVLTKDLRPEDEALLNAVALASSSVEILANKEEVYKIAEEYAHAGLKILVDKVNAPFGSFDKQLEKDLFELCDILGIGSDHDVKKNSIS